MIGKIFSYLLSLSFLIIIGWVALKITVETISGKPKVVHEKLQDWEITIRYARPPRHDIEMFGTEIPFDIVWRTGYKNATEIEFSKPTLVAGHYLRKGKYSLWSIPQTETWVWIINRETGQYGTQYDPRKDIIRFEVKREKLAEFQKKLTLKVTPISAKKAFIGFEWGTTKAGFEAQLRK